MTTLHNFKAVTQSGEEKDLKDYKGKIVLLVNTASKCLFTPQLEELRKLNELIDDPIFFRILVFPQNDFGNQEPLDKQELICFYKDRFPEFDSFSKIKVRGEGIHPIFEYLSSKDLNGHSNCAPKWNFYKYLFIRKVI